MSDYSQDTEFSREWEHQYRRSVYAATVAAYDRAAWCPVEEVYVALSMELQDRGVEVDRDAVYAGAELISRGEQPPILRSGPSVGDEPSDPDPDAG